MLDEAKRYRKEHARLAITGDIYRAELYKGMASRSLQCARLFQKDIHTEELETLHLRNGK